MIPTISHSKKYKTMENLKRSVDSGVREEERMHLQNFLGVHLKVFGLLNQTICILLYASKKLNKRRSVSLHSAWDMNRAGGSCVVESKNHEGKMSDLIMLDRRQEEQRETSLE